MSDRDWDNISVEEITHSENTDTVFLRCTSYEDAAKITGNARNLPRENTPTTPKLSMYVDNRAKKRHRAYLNIAKTLRDNTNNTIQTSLRTGKHDFLLRTRIKGSDTPWSNIPPLIIEQELPAFEIGNYVYILNPANRLEGEDIEEQLSEEDQQEIEMITADLSQQEQTNNKRNRSEDKSSQNEKTNKIQKKYTNQHRNTEHF